MTMGQRGIWHRQMMMWWWKQREICRHNSAAFGDGGRGHEPGNAALEAGKGNRFSWRASRGSEALPTCWSCTSVLQSCKIIKLCCFSTIRFVLLCYGSHRNLIHPLTLPLVRMIGDMEQRAWHVGCVSEAHEGEYMVWSTFLQAQVVQLNESSVMFVPTLTTEAIYRFHLVFLPDSLFSKSPSPESRV